jgi:cell division protein FtsA
MDNLLRGLRSLFQRRHEENRLYYSMDGGYDEARLAGRDGQRQLFTALDIGTAFAKAMIVEVQKDKAVVLGVGRHQQSYTQMADGRVMDIASVTENCNQALLDAEKAAGDTIAPQAVIGIAGELVKGSSTTLKKQRSHPERQITPEELEGFISEAQQKLLKQAKDSIAIQTGYRDIDVRLTNAAVIAVRIDGQLVLNPIGFRGRNVALTLFSAFAPLTHLGALETIAHGLDLTLLSIVVEPYALARCLSANANEDSGAIFIDVGGGTTDIALVRQGGIEETRMFAQGGRAFTHRLATFKNLSNKEAEKLKLLYSQGKIKGSERDEVQRLLAPVCETWIETVSLLIDELSKGDLLPAAIYTAGGGSELPDLRRELELFPWTERLPFAHAPVIQAVQPEMVAKIVDPHGMLHDSQDITPMALAYQAVELQNSGSVLERALTQVIHNMHI